MTNRPYEISHVPAGNLLPAITKWPVGPLGGEVNSVAISGNGKKVVAGTLYHGGVPQNQQFGTYAYDSFGNQLWQDPHQPADGNDNGIYWVALSRDGSWAASGGGHHAVQADNNYAPTGWGYIYAFDVAHGMATEAIRNYGMGGVNIVALSGDGSYLVAGADAAYIFPRKNGTFEEYLRTTDGLVLNDSVHAVAISDNGQLIVYGTEQNNRKANPASVVLFGNPTFPGNPYSTVPVFWQPPAPLIAVNNSNYQHISSAAMAADGSAFAVMATTGNSVCNVYFFSLQGQIPNPLEPSWSYALKDSKGEYCTGSLSLAISANGSRVSAAVNNSDGSGSVFFFDVSLKKLLWQSSTNYGPNSTSVDAQGEFVTVADGYGAEPNPPGDFYLLDSHGNPLILNGLEANKPGVVSWPMYISADGTAIAAGTDDGYVYYFAKPSTGWQYKHRPISHIT